jgi:hypothetical protein
VPWRSKYIAPRQNPLALSAYTLTGLMGIFFLCGIFDSKVLNEQIGVAWQIAWQWLLTFGGVAGLVGVIWPRRLVDVALSLEIAGATAAAFGWLVYAMAVILVAGWGTQVWLLFGTLAAGMAGRAWQASRDRHRIEELARQLEANDAR